MVSFALAGFPLGRSLGNTPSLLRGHRLNCRKQVRTEIFLLKKEEKKKKEFKHTRPS